MSQTLTVFHKELRDSLRDLRSLGAALIYSIVGPLVIALALGSLARQDPERPLELVLQGEERAPGLLRFLQERGVRLLPEPADVPAALRAGKLDLALVVPEDHAKDWRAGRPAKLRLMHDSSRSRARASVQRMRELLREYGSGVASARLLARGLGPELARPVMTVEQDYSTPMSRAALVVAMLPLFLLMSAFIAGMNVAIDVTAGERERGSLAPLLLNPVGPRSLALGKWLATSVFGVLGVVLMVGFSAVVLDSGRLQGLDLRLGLTPERLAAFLGVLVPLALLASSAQMLAATLCRSFKEAQTYLSLLLFVPMLPGFLFEFQALEPAAWMRVVPLLGQQLALSLLLRGETVGAGTLCALGAGSTLAAVGCALICGQLLRSERIVFGR